MQNNLHLLALTSHENFLEGFIKVRKKNLNEVQALHNLFQAIYFYASWKVKMNRKINVEAIFLVLNNSHYNVLHWVHYPENAFFLGGGVYLLRLFVCKPT